MKSLILEILKASFNLEISNEIKLNENNLIIFLPNGKQFKISVE